jgi:DinB superfamily
MTSGTALRTAVIGLIMQAAAEEEMLLSSAPRGEHGGPDRWAAIPVIAHNGEFRQQQVIRLDAVRAGTTPPGFPEVDHQSTQVYQSYAAQTAAEVTRQSRQSVAQLIDGLNAVSDDDLSDSARHPWLRGRQLWLQVVVRGFWHPTGHIGEYYITWHQPARAVDLHAHALATARYLGVPDMALGMAAYSLSCAQAQAGASGQALQTLAEAMSLNPDLRANAARDPDLAPLRDIGRLDVLLTAGTADRTG